VRSARFAIDARGPSDQLAGDRIPVLFSAGTHDVADELRQRLPDRRWMHRAAPQPRPQLAEPRSATGSATAFQRKSRTRPTSNRVPCSETRSAPAG
jgi:hypothetical protein